MLGHAVDEILGMGVAEKICNLAGDAVEQRDHLEQCIPVRLGVGTREGAFQFMPGVSREMRLETLTEISGLERPIVVALSPPLKQRDQVVESHVEIEYPFGGQQLTAQEALRDIGNSDQEVGNEAQIGRLIRTPECRSRMSAPEDR